MSEEVDIKFNSPVDGTINSRKINFIKIDSDP